MINKSFLNDLFKESTLQISHLMHQYSSNKDVQDELRFKNIFTSARTKRHANPNQTQIKARQANTSSAQKSNKDHKDHKDHKDTIKKTIINNLQANNFFSDNEGREVSDFQRYILTTRSKRLKQKKKDNQFRMPFRSIEVRRYKDSNIFAQFTEKMLSIKNHPQPKKQTPNRPKSNPIKQQSIRKSQTKDQYFSQIEDIFRTYALNASNLSRTKDQSFSDSTICSQVLQIKMEQQKTFNKHKIIFCEKKDKKDTKTILNERKAIQKNYGKPYEQPENITAGSYLVKELANQEANSKRNSFRKDRNEGRMHISYNSKISCEIASLTKIMTCILCLDLAQQLNLEINSETIKISSFQCSIEGTSAHLKTGQIYTIKDLLYGLMLPSGNDASLALAVFFGTLLFKRDSKNNFIEDSLKLNHSLQCSQRFVNEMNKTSLDLKLKKTYFSNPHGLGNVLNKSCSLDVCILIEYALKNSTFRQIINSKIYSTTIKVIKKQVKHGCNEKQRVDEILKTWQNTHKLVHEIPDLYKGIKTGVTEAAGPCLASLIKTIEGRQFIIIVLNSKTLKSRFKDTQVLREWLFKKEAIHLKKVKELEGIEQNQD